MSKSTEHPKSTPPAWSELEGARIRSALQVIPADEREIWLRVGMALHWTTWGDRARALWDEWSKKSQKFEDSEQEKAWNSFGRVGYAGPVATLGTLFHLAKQYGWEEPVPNEIAKLNARHFLIRNVGGKCLVGEMQPNPIGSGEVLSLQSVDAFKTWYSNQTIVVGNKPRRRPLGVAWLEHPQRRQYEGVDLVPNAPKELPNGNLNLWRGFGVEAKQGSWRLMIRHIYYVLANDDQKAAEYIFRWMGWSVQHPGEPAEVALVCCAVEKDQVRAFSETRSLGVLVNTGCIFSIKIILLANSTGIFDPVCFCSLTKHFGPGIRRAKAFSRA